MLTLEGVSVRFGGLQALRAVSFSVARGESLGLVGPNGAGKTTLFNAVSGLIRPRGRILFEGRDITRAALHRRARLGIGRTFQVPQPMPGLSVRETLAVAQSFGAGRTDPGRIAEILAATDLTAQAEREAGGDLALQDLKRLEIAKALATEPRLLLLDEVLAGLESAAKRAFAERIRALQARFGLTLILVEHDIETVLGLCSRAVALDFGQVIADGRPEAVFGDPAVVARYTGPAGA